MGKIDLYLGSDLGRWALEQIPVGDINWVITEDNETVKYAQEKGLPVLFGVTNSESRDLAPVGFSVHYPRILSQALIERYFKIYNLHPGFLPWGRGYYPIFWAMWEGTPAGATLHEIVAEVDQGPIVDQIMVEYSSSDTGYTLFTKVRDAEKLLFEKYLMKIINAEVLTSTPQVSGGTFHTKKEFYNLKRNSGWQRMSTTELIRLIRCLSFPSYSGLEITLDGKTFSIRAEVLANQD